MWFWTLPFAANMMKNMKRNPTNPSISNDQMGGGEWSNRGRIVRSQLWQKLWRKIFFLRHFHKIHAPQVPIMCPTWQLQWIFFSGSASELKIPLLKGFVPPTHFQKQVGWWNWLAQTPIFWFFSFFRSPPGRIEHVDGSLLRYGRLYLNQFTNYICLKLPNVFVLNCQMYLPQIVKFICLKLPNIFVSKLQRACCWIARRPIWETAPILETLIQFRTPLVQTLATEEKQPLSPTYWYLSKDYFSQKLLVLDQNKVPFKY